MVAEEEGSVIIVNVGVFAHNEENGIDVMMSDLAQQTIFLTQDA